jgi:hypothetical protein
LLCTSAALRKHIFALPLQAIHNVFGSACYIESSFPAVMYLATKYEGART